jgi:hypothetical protein
MADMYGVNIGGINAPASADYNAAASAIVQGGKNTASALGFLGGLAAQTFTAVKDVDMEQKLRENKEAFTQFGAKQQLSQAQQATQQALEEKNKLLSGVLDGGQINKIKAQDEIISKFTNETSRLEDALANKQISLGRYLGNVQALTKQWIAQFPGRADEIRQQVGQLTGIKNADDFAYQTYLEQQMNMQVQSRAIAIEQAKREQMLMEDDAKRLVKYGEYSSTLDALKAVKSGTANNALERVRRIDQLETGTKSLENDMKNKGVSADQATSLYGSLAFMDASKAITMNDKQFAPIVSKMAQFKNTDGSWNLAKLAAAKDEITPVVGQLTSAVRNSFEARAEMLRVELIKMGSPNVDEQVKKIYAQGETFIKNLESTDSVLAMNTIDKLIANKRTSLQDAFQSIQASNSVITAFAGSKFMGMYNDPSQREALKTQFPEIYNLLETSLNNIQGSSNQVQAMIGSSAAQFITNAEKSISTNGTIPVTSNAKEQKQISEVAEIVGRSAIESLALNKETPTQENANIVSGYVETALKDRGPRSASLLKNEAQLKAAINNMPEGIKAAYLTNVNNVIENVLNPQGQLATASGIIYKTKTVAKAVDMPKDSKGNSQSLIKMQVNNDGYVVPVLEANPAYVAPKGLLEGVTPKGKAPTSRTGMTTTPVPKGRPSVATTLSNEAIVKATREFNDVVTIAATASATERKAMATRFAEAYNTSGEPSATTTSTGNTTTDKNWFYTLQPNR